MAAVTAQTAAQQGPAAVLCLLILLLVLSPSPKRPYPPWALTVPSPPTHPPLSFTLPNLIHGHLADTPTIIISVYQACATPPTCQAWE